MIPPKEQYEWINDTFSFRKYTSQWTFAFILFLCNYYTMLYLTQWSHILIKSVLVKQEAWDKIGTFKTHKSNIIDNTMMAQKKNENTKKLTGHLLNNLKQSNFSKF